MRILKLATTFVVMLAVLASCGSVNKISKVPVPKGSDVIVNMAPKKVALLDYEKENWQHLDLEKDSIPGMSVNKAYELLKGKNGVEVIVGVVDSGTDLKHEDLVDVAWVNTKEVAGDGIDNDNNGFKDDINGWNFLGNIYKENLEFDRILINPSLVDEKTASEIKEKQAKKVETNKTNSARYSNILKSVTYADGILTKHFGNANYIKSQVTGIKTKDAELQRAVAIAKQMYGFGLPSLASAKKELTKLVSSANDVISGANLKKNYRTAVGDNENDINDTPGYGDGKTGHHVKDEAHGSHVSGIIAATRNNGKGMNGVANNVKIMAVRAVPDGDEYDKDVALGIRYAVDNGAKVINTSFGKAYSPHKNWVFDAIKYAASKDVLIVNAAGNDGKNIDVEKTYPNDSDDLVTEIADNVLTIGAMSANYGKKMPAGFSNYGKLNVDIFAPGVQVYSTIPEGGYAKFSGTSMAAPSTAGVAALIRSYYPQLTASQVKHIIMNSGTKIDLDVVKPGSTSREKPDGELVPFSELSVSGRIVNAYNALKMAEKMITGK